MGTKLDHLIHIGKKLDTEGVYHYLFLRRVTPHTFSWFEANADLHENPTSLFSYNIEEAMRLAHREWALHFFRTVNCGFRYTLPERDEHGLNALFYQMIASYSSGSGIYFDEEIGCNCIVHYASQEAGNLWNILKSHDQAS
jgi:hypothetical protein